MKHSSTFRLYGWKRRARRLRIELNDLAVDIDTVVKKNIYEKGMPANFVNFNEPMRLKTMIESVVEQLGAVDES